MAMPQIEIREDLDGLFGVYVEGKPLAVVWKSTVEAARVEALKIKERLSRDLHTETV